MKRILAVLSIAAPIVAWSAGPASAADTAPNPPVIVTVALPNGEESIALQVILYPPGPCDQGEGAICENLGGLLEVSLWPPGPCKVDCPAPPVDTSD